MMELENYFTDAGGKGIISTSDKDGRINTAVYARPHFMEDGQVAFIMPVRQTHKNLLENPHAAYTFLEYGTRIAGRRLRLTMVKEEKNCELIDELRRRKNYTSCGEEDTESRYLVYFKVDEVNLLLGSKV